MMKFLLACALALAGTAASAAPPGPTPSLQRGEFLIGYGGCNDCHTPGWAANGGHAPRNMLLTGGGMNFQGPWGTTYAPNLRLFVQTLTLQQWTTHLRTLKARPAMPYWTFRYLSDADLADMYAYIHSLGPAGKPVHEWVPPGQPAPRPYLRLMLPPPPVQPAGG